MFRPRKSPSASWLMLCYLRIVVEVAPCKRKPPKSYPGWVTWRMFRNLYAMSTSCQSVRVVADLPFNLSLSWIQSSCSNGSKTITSPFLLSSVFLLILENMEVPDLTEEFVGLLRSDGKKLLLERLGEAWLAIFEEISSIYSVSKTQCRPWIMVRLIGREFRRQRAWKYVSSGE